MTNMHANPTNRIGTIRWAWAYALQPYQKNSTGTKGENTIIRGSRISGVTSFPPFSISSTLLLVALKTTRTRINPKP